MVDFKLTENNPWPSDIAACYLTKFVDRVGLIECNRLPPSISDQHNALFYKDYGQGSSSVTLQICCQKGRMLRRCKEALLQSSYENNHSINDGYIRLCSPCKWRYFY